MKKMAPSKRCRLKFNSIHKTLMAEMNINKDNKKLNNHKLKILGISSQKGIMLLNNYKVRVGALLYKINQM